MTITANALARIPGYAEQGAAIERLKDELKRINAQPLQQRINVDYYVDAALNGEEFPKDVAKYNRIIHERNEHRSLSAYMIKEAIRTLNDNKKNLLLDHADKGLAYLDDELTKLMEQIRELHKVLGSIRTAEQVLSANDEKVTQAWKQRIPLTANYEEIRNAQKALSSPGLDEQRFVVAAVGHIRNSLELSAYWLTKRTNNTDIYAARDQLPGVRNFDEWLGAGSPAKYPQTTSTFPDADHWGYLVWLATEATPWVPQIDQLTAAFAAANTAVGRVDYRSFKTQEQARDEYFRIVGEKPVLPYTSSAATEETSERKVNRSGFGKSAARAMGV